MESLPLLVNGKCVADDDELYRNITSAIARGLPEIARDEPPTEQPILVVASGPSLASQIEVIRKMWANGASIMAVRGGHDYLIEHGIIPDFALTVDPLPDSWRCFSQKNKAVKYLIASQVNPAVFDHLSDMEVILWHCYMREGQKQPRGGRMLIGGSTTSGLRSIVLLYVLGYRNFHLFGFDSCMDGDKLRVNGDPKKPESVSFSVQVVKDGEGFLTTPAMALQALHFQDFYDQLAGATFTGYGHGLIQEIIRQRDNDDVLFASIQPHEPNGRVSFIHRGGPDLASYRYRTAIPSWRMGASINDKTASTLIFSKPLADELTDMAVAKLSGRRVIVDFCDDHFEWMHYQEALRLADSVTCNTVEMAKIIQDVPHWGRKVDAIIPDPWEYPLREAHFSGLHLLWFGGSSNKPSLDRIEEDVKGYPLRVVSSFAGAIPWSYQTMIKEFWKADIVLMPATDAYKSANRTVEALRQGCFVIAEPHPSIMDIPGIYIGNIKEGLSWVQRSSIKEVNRRITQAQSYVTEKYSPETITAMWKAVSQKPTTSDVETSIGAADGSMLTAEAMLT